MVSTHKMIQSKKKFGQLYESLNDFIIGNDINANTIENQTTEPQTVDLINISGSCRAGENGESYDQIFEINIADRNRKELEKTVTVVQNQVRDAILTAMVNVVKHSVEMALKLIAESSGGGSSKVVQNRDKSDFLRKMENIPLMKVSSRADLNSDEDKTDETRNFENFRDGDFRK